ncbi:MAG: sialate O-acetylesterase, partial [Verrucomicrobiales bacterium]
MKTYSIAFRRQKFVLLLLAASIASAIPAAADVRLPKIFTNHMMLQRDLPVHVWGWAEPGEDVSVALAGKNATAKASADGQWSVKLPALKEGENLELTITGNNNLILKNIIVGDIWVCSGQSNMEMSLGGCLGANEDIAAADLPKIRQIRFHKVQSGQLESEAPTATPWQVCSPQTAPGFTAVGFYFAREVQKKTGVPIGIIGTNWGGTRIEPWTAPQGMALVEELKPAYEAVVAKDKVYRDGLANSLNVTERWIARARSSLVSGKTIPPAPANPSPQVGGWSGMYNALIVYTSNNGDKQHTDGSNWPFVLLGNAGGRFKTGQYTHINER